MPPLARPQGLPQAPGVDPPVIVLTPVDDHHGNPFGVPFGQLWIIEDGHFTPFQTELPRYCLDDVTGRVTEVTARLSHEDDARPARCGIRLTCRHPASLTPAAVRAVHAMPTP